MTDHRKSLLTELTTATTLEGVELATAKLRALQEFDGESPAQEQDPGLEPPC